MGKSPLLTYGRNFVKGKNSFAVLPYGYFNLIVRKTLWINFRRLHRMEVIPNRDFLEMSLIALASLLNLSSTGSGGTLLQNSRGYVNFL